MCHPVANRIKPHGQYKGVSGGKRNTFLNKCGVLRNGCGTISVRAVLGTGRSHKPDRAPFDSVARYHQSASASLASSTDRTIAARAPRFFMAAMNASCSLLARPVVVLTSR
jgi:hypothetical protein